MPSTATTSTGARVTLAVAPLPQACATIPDPRRTHGRRDAAAALLSLAVVAGLANHAAVLASAA
jgi:hypothetical protein